MASGDEVSSSISAESSIDGYDVFLSFRGQDSRGSFVDSLYCALSNAGIRVFRSCDALRVGGVSDSISEVIKRSKISIPILSKNYASSRWCLTELALFMELQRTRNQKVLPIFFDVTPSEVRRQVGNYDRALRDHEKRNDSKIVRQWRDALAELGALKGLSRYDQEDLGEFVKLVVEDVVRELKGSYLVTESLVGLDDRIETVMGLLHLDANDVRMVGFYGMGGIGKSTLASVVYEKIRHLFDGHCFLKDVKNMSSDHCLQTILGKILEQELQEFPSVADAKYQLERDLMDKRLLIVLDNVDDAKHINELVGDLRYFGLGSRIIATTRNRKILPKGEQSYEYEVKELDQHDAFLLFCKRALLQDSPPKELVHLCKKIVEAAGGLPLSIETVGSYLLAVRNDAWEEALNRFKGEQGIQNQLKISYNELGDKQKQIFLDIACFFIGSDARIPAHMWKYCNFFSEEGIEVLNLMSLIKIGDDNKLWMHDSLRELGLEMVRQENINEPGERSRLCAKEALELLENKKGTRKVEAIRLDYEMGSQPYVISTDKFEGLSDLRYLDLGNANLDEDFQGQLSNLMWLGWHGHTELYVSPSLDIKKLVILDLSRSAINETWNGWGLLKEARNLEVLDLTACHHLKRTPDFSSFPLMERLIFRDCTQLDRIDPSVGHLKMLNFLDVRNCRKLKSLPKELSSLEQVKELLLDESSIEEIPNLSGLTNLEIFSAKSCKSLCRIPESFGSMIKVRKLLLDKCESLVEIPNTIGQLQFLQELSLSHTRVMGLPDPVEKWSNLELLNIDHCPIRSLPSCLGKLAKLEVINASGCVNLKGELPFSLEHLTSLKILRLDYTNISSLPVAIDGLPHLHTLDLEGCMKLQSLPSLPISLVNLKVTVTSSLVVPNLTDLINLKNLELQRHSSSSIAEHPTNDAPSSSSSDLIQSEYKHEVFLSFRGPDTRKNFTNILHTMLTREDIITFIDSEKLHVGEKIDKLLEAINQSKISIPIFSKGYAYSKWCLKEAAQIVKCMEAGKQEVYPIFYDVDPNEVQNQTGDYAKAFRGYVKSKEFDDNLIQEWRNALRKIASRKGLHLKISPDRSYEYQLFNCCCPMRCLLVGQQEEQSCLGTELQKVISDISNKLEKLPLLDVTNDLVGIEDHIVELKRKLDDGINHVKMLGIWGMAGIGKTTIAKSIFNRFASQFKHHSSLENVRGTSLELGSLVLFKRQLLFDISKHKMDFASNATVTSTLEAHLKGKKVLILVDDVDTTEQLDYLIGERGWFGSGSIIIVTTREAHVLLEPKVDWISYEVKPMHQQNAFLLFCKHAFRQDSPLPAFNTLSWDIVEATGRHPLAIQTVGSSLYFVKEKNVWEEARNILRTKKEIHNKLKITYDALSREQQQMFLDIACLFQGADKRVPIHMWKAQNFLPESALRVLLLRSLIRIRDGNILWMHDLFIELGREIVRQESDGSVWNQTRLWSSKDAIRVLNAKMGTEKVKAIHLDCGNELASCFSHENFEKLPNLEFIRLIDANLDGSSNFQGRLSSLIWLSWQGHNPIDIPSGFYLKNLVILDLSKSMIKDDWNGWSSIKEAVNLEVFNLSGCHHLSKTPDFSSFSRMERLILEDCHGLVEIGPSIGKLRALKFLDARNCPNLKKLSQEFGLLVALTELLLDGTLIEELPLSSDMKNLEIISAKSCGLLTNIPPTIGELESLKELNLSRTGVVYLPDSFEKLSNLEVINISHCLIREFPESLWKLRQLEVINASGCRNLKGEIPSDLGSLKILKVLRLDRTCVTSIPESITELSLLRILDLKDCMKLQSLPALPSSLVELKVTLSSSKIKLNLQGLVNLKELEMVYCGELSRVLMDIDKFSKIEKLTISKRYSAGL